MKIKIFNVLLFFRVVAFVLIILTFRSNTYAQSPPTGINYQAIARNTLGHTMSNVANLNVTFSIWDSIQSGNLVYSETHDSVSTNRYGLFTLVIGSKNTTAFDTIHWFVGKKFLQIDIDSAGQNPVTLDRTQFMSVPYALYSKTALYSIANWSLDGNPIDTSHFLGTKNPQDLVFKTNNLERMRINSINGNVGIGTTNPTAPLTIQNINTPGNEIEFLSTGFNADIHANSQLNIGSTQTLNFLTSGITKMHIANNGNIGIGTVSPTASLEIAGQIKINGGGAGAGKVLVSNTTGLASWQHPNQIFTAGTGITFSGNNTINTVWTATNLGVDIYNNNTANVGIGTSTPSSKLDVNGTITITGNNNELNRPQTGAANLVPIAYGSVNAAGTPSVANTGNFTVNLVDGTLDDYYEISFNDGSYYTSTEYITVVTPGEDNLKVSAKGVNGLLKIKFTNVSNNGLQSAFQFIVYKP